MSEILIRPHPHFEEHHLENGEAAVCMQHNGECSVLIEIAGSPEEEKLLAGNAEKALDRLDQFFDGRFAELFPGLHIKIGDGLVEGGALADAANNRVLADRQKMLINLKESEELLKEFFEPGERTRVMSAEETAEPGSVLQYELIHEIGHLLDEQPPGPAGKRVDASESPTKYGRVPDKWHANKDHEAFAEGFTHMVFGADVSPRMQEAVQSAVEARVSMFENNRGEL